MSKIPKQEPTKRKTKPAPPHQESTTKVVVTGPDKPHYTPSIQHDINHVAGLGEVATHLDWIGDAVARLTNDDHAVRLSVAQGENTNPVQLTLSSNDYDDTMGRLVTALERIADSVAKLAGLNRPRLEEWHHQDAYEPRYYDAPGGEAPGPKSRTADGQGT